MANPIAELNKETERIVNRAVTETVLQYHRSVKTLNDKEKKAVVQLIIETFRDKVLKQL